MAFTTYGNSTATTTSLRARLAARLDTARENLAKWRLYRETLAELSALSNRDLSDLGLHRSMIKSLAIEAAYGK
ncbi:DUF1127 domain-containing protein [Jannaschia sp. M317]|uniref:DUF1127 domain-containing protein n=1 Tax=Jannaschia sp. M317 TaxID=2867011 RepID=UPI0021A6F233|nr:DUF1127 domain-containing protein [Jannaschia sp. M317]UWQ19323.1 DUF1127 domain-containing protein [Jannaschia sp. M317]